MIIDIKDINIVLVVVIIVLVIFCLIRNEHFFDGETLQPLPTTCGVERNPYSEINTFHPNEEGGGEVNRNNYMFAITNTDNKQIYGLGSSLPEPKTAPVPANSGE